MDESGSQKTEDGGAVGTVLTCRAPHPKALDGDPRYQGRVHGVRLQVVPFRVRPTYRRVDDWSQAEPGCMVVRCPGCGAFTEYAIIGELKSSSGPRDRTSLLLLVASLAVLANCSPSADPGAVDDEQPPVVNPGSGTGNVRVRWMGSSGTAITSASVGQTVEAQLCSPLDVEAVDGQVRFSSRLTYVSSAELNSAAAGVHPDCVGTLDNLKDFFTPNPQAGNVQFGVVSVTTSPSHGTVGIAELTFVVAGRGTETLSLSNFQLALRGGSPVAATYDVVPLVIP